MAHLFDSLTLREFLSPLFVWISATERIEGGWSLEDSVALARELRQLGQAVTWPAQYLRAAPHGEQRRVPTTV